MDINSAKKNKLLFITIPMVIIVIGALLMISTIIMPYASATDEQLEIIESMNGYNYTSVAGITVDEMDNISMIEYAKIYNEFSNQIWGNPDFGKIYSAFITLMSAFSLIAILFASAKKPIGTIISAVVAFAIFMVQSWDYTDRGVIGNGNYVWGIGYYVFYVAVAAVLIGSIWMLIGKKKIKSLTIEQTLA